MICLLMWIDLLEVRDHCFLDWEVMLNPFQVFVLHLEEQWILCLANPQKSKSHQKKIYPYTKFLTWQQPKKGNQSALRARSRFQVPGSRSGLEFGIWSVFVICHGQNSRQNQAICDEILERLKKEKHRSPTHIEGYQHADWILMDYLDFVVHIFSPRTRQSYKLEKLWGDGVKVQPKALTA